MARQGFPSDKQDQFVVRFPDGVRDKVKQAADETGRSMNAMIIAFINEGLAFSSYLKDQDALRSENEPLQDTIDSLILKMTAEYEENLRRAFKNIADIASISPTDNT